MKRIRDNFVNKIRKEKMKKRLKESRLKRMNDIPVGDSHQMEDEYKASFRETVTILKSINPENMEDILVCLKSIRTTLN